MIKEMRLKGIKTIKEANKFLSNYLPAYSKRFAVQPANNTDLHRPIPEGINLDKIFCVKTARALRNDYTIAHNVKLYQIQDSLSAKEVIVEERVNGSMLITYKNRSLKFNEITTKPQKEKKVKSEYSQAFRPKGIHVTPKDHPWRNRMPQGYPVMHSKEEVLAGAL